ncbi:MAG: DUF72 domain-containing protein [Actinomycetota bacterium]|nr:DUF72 domain-containing protein [Actinomycetota bacterium]
MAEVGTLYAGTSGFAYKEWKGPFYPEDAKDKDLLAHYSALLPSVEINYTFRRLPADTTLEKWKTGSTDKFRFTLKASQRITHFKRLKEVTDDVETFVGRARILGEKLGTVLFQLPPNLAFEKEVLAKFLGALPPGIRYAMEFRHASWNEPDVDILLKEHAVARCGADTEETPVDEVPITARHVYLRLRRLEYEEEALDLWTKKVSDILSRGHDVYCYFKHEGGGIGPAYATRVLKAATS